MAVQSHARSHWYVTGEFASGRNAQVDKLDLARPLVPKASMHRRLRGPYTGAGTIVRALVPAVLVDRPDLVKRHEIEILSVAPELADIVPASRETLTSLAIPAERTRFYASMRTQRIAHGLTEFLRDAAREGDGTWCLIVDDVEEADATDIQFLVTAVRRIPAEHLQIVICARPSDALEGAFAAACDRGLMGLKRIEDPVDPWFGRGTPGTGSVPDSVSPIELAHLYVDSDGTSDDHAAIAAYGALDPARRQQLHDDRAAELESVDQVSLRLGAIPFHREFGTDPSGAGVAALRFAIEYSICLGFYDAAIEIGARGLDLVDQRRDPASWWVFVGCSALSLAIQSRPREAEGLLEAARLSSVDPKVHMAIAYSIAMLYTRHHDEQDQDERKAKAWLNGAIATASLIDDSSEGPFLSAFYRNGLALVEVNLGDPAEALRLVNECIEDLDARLDPSDHRLHRTVLKNNRARVLSMIGRLDDALRDYATVIDADPNHAEHYLERGNILRRMGRFEEALADYGAAISLSPPFLEVYYNRADLRLTVGDRAGALEDFAYVLELDPDVTDARINRAGIHLEHGDWGSARADARAGLQTDPTNPDLLTILGQVSALVGAVDEAFEYFDQALRSDPDFALALAARGAFAFELGDLLRAEGDLSAAVTLAPEDAALRFNLATVYLQLGRTDDARRELYLAADAAPDDREIAAALSNGLGG